MSLNNKILKRCSWIVLLSLFYVVSCKESIIDKWDANEYKSNKALINYAKVLQDSRMHNKRFFEFIYPPDTAYHNFISRRCYALDSSFIEYGILGFGAIGLWSSMYSEIKNGHWYLFDGYKWQLFYDGKKLHPVDLLYTSKLLTPCKKYTFKHEYLYSFETDDTYSGIPSEHLYEYIFSPNRGIVLIKSSKDYFRRKDFNFNPNELKLVGNVVGNDSVSMGR